ncbi:MAG: hypothetical protein J6S76_06005 [Clostridia bacterium]|nr:hypothetical protein [Clostridia bacterium]
MSLITRSAMRSYLSVDGVYNEIGEGFTDFTENKNPREYSRRYIHESTERTDLVGFAPSVTYAFDVCDADCVQEHLLKMTMEEEVGADARVTVVTAFLYRPGEREGCVRAIRRAYTVCPARLGSGTEALICSGTMKACAEAEVGEFDPQARLFYAAGTEEAV